MKTYFVRHRYVPTGALRISILRAYTALAASLLMKAAHPHSVVTELRPATELEVRAWERAQADKATQH